MRVLTTLLAVSLVLASSSVQAAEICGNGLDDDADGLADEGCYPTLTTGQCESPLSCEETGMVSPLTGSLRYSLPPDVAPKVPWGFGIGLRRFYLSQYAPAGGAPVWKKPMGERWGHTYMTWIDDIGSSKIVYHTNRGQDVLLTKTGSGLGVWQDYAPQPGVHFKSFKRRVASPFDYEITTLTGERLLFNGSGRLTTLQDSLAAPSSVAIAYDGNGQVSTVVDASGNRRLLFAYTGNVLTSVKFELITSGWSTQHTTTYAYTSSNLTSVTIGGQLANTISYTSNYVTSIADGNSNTLVNFVYDGTVAGKVVRIDTPTGVLGWEFNSARSNCSGKTVLHFHRGNTSSCSIDADCGAGFLCGGKTGAGSTGQCFRGARCLTVASPSEDVITTVSSFGPGVETCDGACLQAIDHVWNTTSGKLDLTAVKDPSNYYTTKDFDANGLPITIVYGDTDSLASNGNGQRTAHLFYGNPSFPGRVTEVRRVTELNPSGGTCTRTSKANCAVTGYGYDGDGLLSSVDLSGSTKTTIDTITPFTYSTTYSYDKGRVTAIHGPIGNDTLFAYWDVPADSFKHGFLQTVTRYKTASTFLTQSSVTFDFWGNASSLQDSDGTISCQTFDAARGFLAERRETMNGQVNCTSPHVLDLVTAWQRDSALRLTKLTRPDGSCAIYEYETRGRLSKTKRRDDCNAASSGDREEYTYSADGLITKVETFDAASTVTKRQELTYYDSRKLATLINPVNTAKWMGLTYEARGLLNDTAAKDGATNLSKTEWSYDAEGRTTAEKRYTSGSSFDTWNLLFDWIGGQKQVTDGDSKTTLSERDDAGRVVKLSSPDLGGDPTLRIYDAAGRLVTLIEHYNSSGTNTKTHQFTYDYLGRPLNADYAGTCATWNNPDIVRVYDAAPTSCPAGTACTNLAGRLAYVKVKLMCLSSLTDQTLEQETFYGYDAAGRMTHEYIRDDTGRTAAQQYSWTKNSALAQVTLPSTAVIGWTYGSAANNSDTDRISALWRTSTATPIADVIQWEPYGPLKQYNQQNTVSGVPMRTKITHNLAYRTTQLEVEDQVSGNNYHYVLNSEDAAGRVTKRDYFPVAGNQDSYFKYDQQDRVLCETTTSVASCPTSGAGIKNSHSASPPFTAAGDWKRDLRPTPGTTGLINDFTLTAGTHQIASVSQSDGSPVLGTTAITYNGLGNRSSDDNTSTLTNDLRTYSYDARRNVTNVHGKYFTSGVWHDYDVTSTFDADNRRVSKSFLDNSTSKVSTWFFYYDAHDRLSEIRYTPDTASSGTYSVFQLFWLIDRLILYWQTDYPSTTTSKRYVGTDESQRPVDMICWSNTPGANCPRVWSVNPDGWGDDTNLVGPTVFQPILFAGQYRDEDTVAWQNDGATKHRQGLVLNGYRTYDARTASYIQPLLGAAVPYAIAGNNPVYSTVYYDPELPSNSNIMPFRAPALNPDIDATGVIRFTEFLVRFDYFFISQTCTVANPSSLTIPGFVRIPKNQTATLHDDIVTSHALTNEGINLDGVFQHTSATESLVALPCGVSPLMLVTCVTGCDAFDQVTCIVDQQGPLSGLQVPRDTLLQSVPGFHAAGVSTGHDHEAVCVPSR
ncbi:MAG: hypothetical protein ABI867_01800 [Kofleriaceae bacterium]